MDESCRKIQRMFWLCLLLFGVSNAYNDRSCGPKFKGKCTCGHWVYDNDIQYVVNCTNQGYTSTEILADLPPDTEVLIFVGNNISLIPQNIFGTIDNYPRLRVVDMSNNHIKDIRGKTYHHVKTVERLILNHNEIKISEDEINYHHPRVFSNFINLKELHLVNAFADNTDATLAEDLHDIFANSNLTKLYKLHLEQNEIYEFRDHRIFCELPQLHDLHLGDNFLIGIKFNLTCLKHLRYLDLQNNKIEILTRQELSVLDKIAAEMKKEHNFTINLNGNPFPCDCTIANFTSWLKSTNVTVKDAKDMKCVKSKGNPGSQILQFKVPPCKTNSKSAPTKKQKAAVGLLILVTIFVLSVIILIIYTGKYKLRTKITPLVEAITKKVQYTTIKNRDNIDDT